MGTYRVFNGTDWIDICKCNVRIKDTTNNWQLLDPKNCTTRYWTGTEWCPISCDCVCAEGFTYNTITNNCEKTIRVPATPTSPVSSYNIVVGSKEATYGNLGARLYDNITNAVYPINGFGGAPGVPYILKDNAGLGTLYNNTLSNPNNNIFNTQGSSTTKGRLNYSSMFAAGFPGDTWFTVTFCLNITVPKTYIFGIAADNQTRASITSTTFRGGVTSLNIVNLWDSGVPGGVPTTTNGRPFNYWHMFPIDLPVGNHVFELAGYNFGTTSAALGAEVYDISVTDLQNLMASTTATPADLQPHVLFTTKDLVQNPPLQSPAPGTTPTYSCPAGTTFTSCYGVPQCVRSESYICDDVLKCGSFGLSGNGGAGMYKIPVLIPANVCDISVVLNVNNVPDSIAIMDFGETQYYAQSGFFGDSTSLPAVGSYNFGPTVTQKIYKYAPGSSGNFTEDTTAPTQTLDVIAQQFPVTNTDPNKIPIAINSANPNQTVRTITWNKGQTANDVIAMIRIVGNPQESSTIWTLNAVLCSTNCI